MTQARPVEFSLSAESDLQRVFDYISAANSPAIAESYIGRIVTYCRSLGNFPERGSLRNDIVPGMRVVGFERRVTIAFTVTPAAVVIQGVFYGGRDLGSLGG